MLTPASGKLRQEDQRFEGSLSWIVRLSERKMIHRASKTVSQVKMFASEPDQDHMIERKKKLPQVFF